MDREKAIALVAARRQSRLVTQCFVFLHNRDWAYCTVQVVMTVSQSRKQIGTQISILG